MCPKSGFCMATNWVEIGKIITSEQIDHEFMIADKLKVSFISYFLSWKFFFACVTSEDPCSRLTLY